MNIIIAWLGNTDLNCARGETLSGEPIEKGDLGPVGQALTVAEGAYDLLYLLTNEYGDVDRYRKDVRHYKNWVKKLCDIQVETTETGISDPTDYRAIYEAAEKEVGSLIERMKGDTVNLTFHVTPGTPAMQTVWVLLANSQFKAQLIQSSKEKGVKKVDVPFEIDAEFIPKVLEPLDRKLKQSFDTSFKKGAKFGDIVYRSKEMHSAVSRAKKVAKRHVPILIQGETGTGKELFANAIYNESLLNDKPFESINCGAIPKELLESELFGYVKGAFTGANTKEDKKGVFQRANGGTLFLDEIGELPLDAQVKLLRATNSRNPEIQPVGGKPQPVNVRIIAATNRDLLKEVAEGRFREDLYYRLALCVINLPPLRDRQGDIAHLTETIFERVI
ncbi:MAG: RNA repair transcriptional activator RtcR family protein, partial [Emcibacteraceae bacterium]|nr:RNA repair transcriptional activator RtcR family protein [Emcibacteraceae bacterium]